jgi:hypothetical protein
MFFVRCKELWGGTRWDSEMKYTDFPQWLCPQGGGGGGGYETKHVLVSLWSCQIVKLNVRVRVMPLVALKTWIECQRVGKRTLSVTLLNRSMLLRLDSPSVTPGTDTVLYWRKADWTRYQGPPLPNLFRIGLELKRWNIRCLLLRYCTRHVFFKYIFARWWLYTTAETCSTIKSIH